MSISFFVEVVDQEELVGRALDGASLSTQGIATIPDSLSENKDLIESRLGKFQTAFDAVDPLLEKFESFVTLMDKVTEIHPYVRAAWIVFSAIPKIFIRELAQNKQILGLLDSLKETYHFVVKDRGLQEIGSQHVQQLILQLANLTQECAYFIQSYGQKSHKCRLLETIISSPEKRIADLVAASEDIRGKLTAYLTQIAAVGAVQSKDGVEKVLEGMAYVGDVLESINQKIDLNDIPYAGGASYNKNKCCMPNTRISVLKQLCDWIDCFEDDDDERAFLLTGVAGSGKSAIAHSISDHYKQRGRLGSAFFFNTRSSNPAGGDKVFSTIARDIADLYPLFKAAVAKAANTRRIRQSDQPREQFQSFIVEPSKALEDSDAFIVGPIVLVIDALDECPVESKEEFFQAFVDILPDIPPNFRIVITARPENVQDLLSTGLVRHIDLGSIGPTEANSDITLFVQNRLSRVARRLDDPRQQPHHPNWVNLLVQRSETLFIWAETACKQIASPISRTPSQVLDDILKHGGSGIDSLYLLALRRAFGDDEESEDEHAVTHFKSLMSRIAILSLPFSVNELNFLQSVASPNDDFPTDVSFLIPRLGAVLGGATDWNQPVQYLHSSFQDFLLNPKRSGRFCISSTGDFADAHFALANACVAATLSVRSGAPKPETMEKADPGGFGTHEEKSDTERYSRVIAYAALFWAMHLHRSGRMSLNEDLASVDLPEIRSWCRDQQVYFDKIAVENGISLIKCARFLSMTEADMLKELEASQPPSGYTMKVSPNDRNDSKLKSSCARITLTEANPEPSDVPWSTSMCCLPSTAAIGWENATLGFLTRQQTVLVWSLRMNDYQGKPINVGSEDIVGIHFSFDGETLALLTAGGELIVTCIESGDVLTKFAIPDTRLKFFGVFDDDIVIFKSADAQETRAYDICEAKFHPDVSKLDISDSDIQGLNQLLSLVEEMCHLDDLEST